MPRPKIARTAVTVTRRGEVGAPRRIPVRPCLLLSSNLGGEMKSRFLLAALFLLLPIGSLFAQGVQTATLQGTVTDASGAPLPGVTVTVKSPALMGERTAVSQSSGDYILRGLNPGDYTITFNLEGMQTNTVHRNLALGLTTIVDAKMKVAAVTEAITV